VACALWLGGCATFSHGRTQEIQVVTKPPGARATLPGQAITTPGRLVIARRSEPVVELSREGCAPVAVKLDRRLSPELWRNNGLVVAVGAAVAASAPDDLSGFLGILAGVVTVGVGVTGFGVDLVTGGAFELHPGALYVELVCDAVRPPAPPTPGEAPPGAVGWWIDSG
jgi:hypothetical protein